EIVKRIGSEIEEQTGNTVELQSRVDPDILGGLVVQVGNMVLDTSIRNRLEKLRKSVAQAAEERNNPHKEIKTDEIASILRERIEGMDVESADLSEVGTVLEIGDGIAR